MPEGPGWSLASFAGLRRAQHAAFMELSFREKLVRLEQMADVQRRLEQAAAAQRDRAGPGDEPPEPRTP